MFDALPMFVGDGRTRVGNVVVAASDWAVATAAKLNKRETSERQL